AARRRHGNLPPKPVPSRSRFIFYYYLPTTTGLRYSPAKIYPAILPASGKIVCWRGTVPRAGACQRRVPGWKAVPGVNARSGDRRVDLAAITQAASRETGGVPAGLLGGYLPAVLGAASSGRRLAAAELAEDARGGERGRPAWPGRSVPVRDLAAVARTARRHRLTRGVAGRRAGRAAGRRRRGGRRGGRIRAGLPVGGPPGRGGAAWVLRRPALPARPGRRPPGPAGGAPPPAPA